MASLEISSARVHAGAKVQKNTKPKKRAGAKKSAKGKRKVKPTALNACDIFPFTQLPTEIRDIIYEYVAVSLTTTLPRKSKKSNLISSSSLTAVSRQIREEFCNILSTHANPIRTTVLNFNFSHVVRFLNTLSDRELNMLPTLVAPSEREFIITLDATEHPNDYYCMLGRWLRRCEHPTKKGTNINISYEFPLRLARHTPACGHQHRFINTFGGIHPLGMPFVIPQSLVDHSLVVSMREKMDQRMRMLRPGRAMDELKKMRAAEVEQSDWETTN